MRIWWLLLVTLAACPKRTGGGGTGPTSVPGVGCPAAQNIYVASFISPEEGDKDSKSRTGWVLPLHDVVVGSLQNVPEYATIDAAAATAAGVPAPPQNLWLLGGPQPCKATVGSYYAAAIDVPTPNVAYGVELAGCPAPPDPANASAIIVVSDASPGECQLVGPRGVAARLGEMDKQGVWQRPVKETPIPPVLAALVPKKPCMVPSCEMLWSIAQVDVGNQPVAWAGAVNWLAVPANPSKENQCEWKAERFSGFFVAGAGGVPVQVTEGQDHPLALTAVLADKAGAKVLVAEGPGEYSTYDLGGGKATLGRHVIWLRPHPDSYEATDHLGPVCGE